MHTSLHKRPAPEMTICSSNLISPWATMTVNENMAYALGHMQVNWVLGLSVGSLLAWYNTISSLQCVTFVHFHLEWVWCLYLFRGEFCPLVLAFITWLQFLIYFIWLSCFHLNCIVTSSCICNHTINSKKQNIYIGSDSFRNMVQSSIHP